MFPKSSRVFVLLVAMAGMTLPQVRADALRPHAMFSDHMVLQAGLAAPVWGIAAPGEEVTVEIAGQQKTARADAEGKWMVRLDPMAASETPTEMTIRDAQTSVKIQDVLVGEIWVAAGQSNMQFALGETEMAESIADTNYPQIRFFVAQKIATQKPVTATGQWIVCTPETARGLSAVGFCFARKLHRELKAPVGVFQSEWGGTCAEAWTSRAGLESEPELAHAVDQLNRGIAASAELGQVEENSNFATNLFIGMIQPFIPYGIRGVIWYQGESNTPRAWQYRVLFRALIRDWRRHWGQGDFPFLFVQLANYGQTAAEPGDSIWAELRESQTLTLREPATGMAVAIDVGEGANIHPKNKLDVGLRLARWALATVYGRKDLVFSGPLYKSSKKEVGRIRVEFDHIGGGLVAKDGALRGFAIAGGDGKFIWADAVIDGDAVLVSSAGVPDPQAVRYAWADNPEGCNLYNKAGLPASPFRTDDLPLSTGK